MVEITYDDKLKKMINNADKLRQRLDVNKIDQDVLSELKVLLYKLFEKRKKLLQEEFSMLPSDVVNLCKVERRRELKSGYVIIKIGDIIAPIKIADGTFIVDNFTATHYSIVKRKNGQVIEHACEFDIALYTIVEQYVYYKSLYVKTYKKDLDVKLNDYKNGEITLGALVKVKSFGPRGATYQVINVNTRTGRYKIKSINFPHPEYSYTKSNLKLL